MSGRAQYIARHDSLTGLAHRYRLRELFELRLADSSRGVAAGFAIVMLDGIETRVQLDEVCNRIVGAVSQQTEVLQRLLEPVLSLGP